MSFHNIIHPLTKHSFSIFSNNGKELLKYYIKLNQNGGGISNPKSNLKLKLKSKSKNTKLSILLISCDAYHLFSPISLYFIKKNIANYFGSNIYYTSETSKINDKNVTNINTKHINGKHFVKRLHYVLNKINSKYIFLIQEDHWFITKLMNKNIYDKILEICEKNDLDQLKLLPISGFHGIKKTNDIIYTSKDMIISWANGTKYPVSHHATIFKKKWLLNNLENAIDNNKLTPWEHEVFNFNIQKEIKGKHIDNKIHRIAYIKYLKNIGILESVVAKGKLSKKGHNILKQNKKNKIFEKLLNTLPNTTFLSK